MRLQNKRERKLGAFFILWLILSLFGHLNLHEKFMGRGNRREITFFYFTFDD